MKLDEFGPAIEAPRKDIEKLFDVPTQLINSLADSMVSQKDNLIIDAINTRIGTNWKIEDLKGRLDTFIYPDKTELFCLDGEALIYFTPVELDSSDPLKIKAVQKYLPIAPGTMNPRGELSEEVHSLKKTIDSVPNLSMQRERVKP